jgi:hypothetical protein
MNIGFKSISCSADVQQDNGNLRSEFDWILIRGYIKTTSLRYIKITSQGSQRGGYAIFSLPDTSVEAWIRTLTFIVLKALMKSCKSKAVKCKTGKPDTLYNCSVELQLKG